MENPEVKVRILHSAVGAINESDILLASTAGAIVIGFHVRPEPAARDAADRSGVDVHLYRVIYDCIEEIETAMKGMLAPKYREAILGHAEVRQTFKASGIGTIAGCYVTDGVIRRNTQVRVLRDNIEIFEGDLASLKRFKDDAREVATGYECGMNLERFNDIKVGDIIEAFIMEEIKH
jgi:translation initiation factor IF-2